jgi:hypothetical protein
MIIFDSVKLNRENNLHYLAHQKYFSRVLFAKVLNKLVLIYGTSEFKVAEAWHFPSHSNDGIRNLFFGVYGNIIKLQSVQFLHVDQVVHSSLREISDRYAQLPVDIKKLINNNHHEDK